MSPVAGAVMAIDPLRIRSILGRKEWSPPREFLTDAGDRAGWWLARNDATLGVVVSAEVRGGVEYLRASISTHGDQAAMPTLGDLTLLHHAVFAPGYSYQAFPPPLSRRFPLPTSLHLYGRLDGEPVLPEI